MSESNPVHGYSKPIKLLWLALAFAVAVLLVSLVTMPFLRGTGGFLEAVSRWSLVVSALVIVVLPVRLWILYRERTTVDRIFKLTAKDLEDEETRAKSDDLQGAGPLNTKRTGY